MVEPYVYGVCVCMACVHMRVFGENQTGDSLQREQYVQRPRRVGSLALERSSPSRLEGPGWEGRGWGEMYLEKQAGPRPKEPRRAG